MKAALILLCLAVFVAAVFAECNPDNNGEPTCTGTSSTKYRNNWDPTHYWVCEGNTAVSMPCESGGFDAETSECIPWDTWQWVEPC